MCVCVGGFVCSLVLVCVYVYVFSFHWDWSKCKRWMIFNRWKMLQGLSTQWEGKSWMESGHWLFWEWEVAKPLVEPIQMCVSPACASPPRPDYVSVLQVVSIRRWTIVSGIDPDCMPWRLRLMRSSSRTILLIIRQSHKTILEHRSWKNAWTTSWATWVLAWWQVSWALLSRSPNFSEPWFSLLWNVRVPKLVSQGVAWLCIYKKIVLIPIPSKWQNSLYCWWKTVCCLWRQVHSR